MATIDRPRIPRLDPGTAIGLLLQLVTTSACREPTPGTSSDAGSLSNGSVGASVAAPVASTDATSPPAAPLRGSRANGDARTSSITLHAARGIEPRTGQVVAPLWLTIEDGVVRYVGSTAPAKSSEHLVELGESTVTPGLIDAHSHLLHGETPEPGSMVSELVMLSDADRALRGAHWARQMLDAGFTTVRDLGNSGRGGDVSLKRAIRSGWVEGPAMIVSTRALAPPGGQFPLMGGPHPELVDREYAVVATPDEARSAVRQAFAEGADCIKLIVDQGVRAMTFDEVHAAVVAAHAAGRKVAAHVLTEKSAALAVDAGVDSLEHAYAVTDATLTEMARKKVFLVPTDYPLDYYEMFVQTMDAPEAARAAMTKMHVGSVDRLRRALKLRVPIAAGSDAYELGKNHDRGVDAARIFASYAEAGMSPVDIVRAATSGAAELLGLPEKAGGLVVGAPADIAAFEGDASRNVAALTHVQLVIQKGRIVRDELTRDSK